jgi:hypothetical protein
MFEISGRLIFSDDRILVNCFLKEPQYMSFGDILMPFMFHPTAKHGNSLRFLTENAESLMLAIKSVRLSAICAHRCH